jgi:hypothetical protein
MSSLFKISTIVRSISGAIVILFGVSANGATAQTDICATIIAFRAFDIYDSTVKSHLQQNAADDICSVQWNTDKEARDTTAKWDSNASAFEDMFKGTGNGFWNTNSHSAQENYAQLCIRTNRSVLANYFAHSYTQIASNAVNAWRACVLGALQQFGLFSELTITPDRSAFALKVVFKPVGEEKLKIVGYDSKGGYGCKIGNKDAQNIDAPSNDFTLSCTPTKDTDILVAITTNALSIGPYTVRSGQYLDLVAQLETLTIRVKSLEEEKDSMTDQFSALKLWDKNNPPNMLDWADKVKAEGKVDKEVCPDGMYATGIATRGQFDNGTTHSVALECRQLPIK